MRIHKYKYFIFIMNIIILLHVYNINYFTKQILINFDNNDR